MWYVHQTDTPNKLRDGEFKECTWKYYYLKSAVKWSEVKCREVKGVKSGCTVKGIYGWWSEAKWSDVKWSAVNLSEVKCSAVKGVKSGCTVKGIYG